MSDGTITTSLQALLLDSIEVEVRNQCDARLDAASAEFLSAEPGSLALAREVWLTARGVRRVCASSVIILNELDPSLLQSLRKRERPLGRLLNESGRPVLRDRLQIASINDPSRIKTLGLTGAVPVWVRRYRMNIDAKPIALIMELFVGPPMRPI